MNQLDDLAARSLRIVGMALLWQDQTEGCHFCERERGRRPHSEDCPLVEEGFIDRGGELLVELPEEPPANQETTK
jgi:hypothetical protein